MEEITYKEFFQSWPPGKFVVVSDFTTETHLASNISKQEIQLHCDTEECNGIRFFSTELKDTELNRYQLTHKYIHYYCRNCRKNTKTFSLRFYRDKETEKWHVFKYGEFPSYGSPTPSKVFNLIGGERNLFIMGRRCENQGMGIGAFVYYRRVMESQKLRIFDEIIRVVRNISPNDLVIEELEKAKAEVQFTKAVESLKHALPQSLFINGYNPLTLLHSALSEGVHAHTDEECLDLASSVRTVLFEFAERLGAALKEEAALTAAVNKLANKPKQS